MRRPFLQDLLERLSTKLEAKVFFADQFGYAGYIEFKTGKRTFFRGTAFDINPHGASRIAADKDYSAKFLKHLGYAVPEGILVFSPRYRMTLERRNRQIGDHLPGLEGAVRFADQYGFPLFVKPNDASEGRGVSRVYSFRQLVDDIQGLFEWTEQVLVQRPVAGNDYRVVVLGSEVLSAYRRQPFKIEGDELHSIGGLIERKIGQLRAEGRGSKIDIGDPRILREITQQGLSTDYIPAIGHTVFLLPNANLSTGGEAEDVTTVIHPSVRSLCASVARDMGLTLCGVDIMAPDITRPPEPATVLEINSAPGLNNFAARGGTAARSVEELYEKILLRIRDDRSADRQFAQDR